jgi:hypothetical protein
MRKDGWAAFLLVIAGLPPSLASAAPGDPFVGARTVVLFGDDNISDGVQLHSYDIDLTVTTDDGSVYTVTTARGDDSFSLTMVRDGNLLTQSPRPQGTTINGYLFSDGVNGAFLFMGQEMDNPLDISIHVATWAGDGPFSSAQLAGDWSVTLIEDANLRDDPEAPFGLESQTVSITDLGEDRVAMDIGDTTWTMQINGNVLEPLPGTLDSGVAHLSLMTDGYTIVMGLLGVELRDPSDVSATIGFSRRDLLFDWNGDGIVSIVGDVPPFVDCVYFGNYPDWPEERLRQVGDCNGDGILSIVGDVPCFVDCAYFGNCP